MDFKWKNYERNEKRSQRRFGNNLEKFTNKFIKKVKIASIVLAIIF